MLPKVPQMLTDPNLEAHPGQTSSAIRLIIKENYEEMSRVAAQIIADELRSKPGLLLCAATGSTPTLTYDLLTAKRKEDPSLFPSLRLVKLDEWGGLPMADSGSCETYLQNHLVRPLGIPPERYISFQSEAEPRAECARIARTLDAEGPIDLCVLGLGLNGHLGFNEPGNELLPLPHRAELAPGSLQHPMIRDAKVPLSYGLTLGMSHVLQSRKIIFLVNGAHKAPAMKEFLAKRISTQFPASFLWLHPQIICLCDTAAVS